MPGMIAVVDNVVAGVMKLATNTLPLLGDILLVVIVVCAPVLGNIAKASFIGETIGRDCVAVTPS